MNFINIDSYSLNEYEKNAIQLIEKVVSLYDCNSQLHIEQRSNNYLSVLNSANGNDFLRLKFSDRTKWISLSMWGCDESIQNDVRFSHIENKNQRHWKIPLESVNDIANYSDAIIESYKIAVSQTSDIGIEIDENQRISASTLEIFVSIESPNKTKRNKGKSLLTFPDNYCVIDIETTGLDPNFDEIIELAAIRISNNQIVDTFQSLVKPLAEIDEFIEQLTGITNSMVADAPKIEEILPDFLSFVGNSVLVGHNINFDINFIYDYALQFDKIFSNDFIDTMRLSKKIYPQLAHHRLIDMIALLQIPVATKHRALADCESTYGVLEALRLKVIAEYNSIENFVATTASKRHCVYGVRARDVKSIRTVFDETNPLFGKLCVFTGTLKFPRSQAMQYVVDFGGKNGDNLTKDTNFLIVGDYEKCVGVKGNKTGKMKKAESYRLKGCDIQVLSEDAFYDIIEEFGDELNVSI